MSIDPKSIPTNERNYVLAYYRSDVSGHDYFHIHYVLKRLGEEMHFLEAYSDGHSWADLGELMFISDRLQMLQAVCEFSILGRDDIESIINTY